MRKQLLIGATMIAATALIVLAGSARAEEYLQPPPEGWSGSFRSQFVVCDTKDQISEIAKLGEATYAPMHDKLTELYQKANGKGEHTCILAPITNMVVGENEDLGFIVDSAGVKSKAWAVHIGNPEGDWWMLYAVHAMVPEGQAI